MIPATSLLLVLAAPQGQEVPQAAPKPAAAPLPLTVEYVGNPSSARGRDFAAFLRTEFQTVDVTDARSLKTPEDAAAAFEGADVLVIDTNLAGRLPAAYGMPMVVLSGPGVQTAEGLGAKLDWL